MNRNIIFLSHGGGPLPLLGDPAHKELADYLQALPHQMRKPSAILVISAHWEEQVTTITANANPSLIYDYYGFPPESYNIQYPCAGEPQLALQVYDALNQANIPVSLDENRGFDHGLFVPLKLMYPEADIPCIQLSLVKSMDAKEHLAIGKALQNLDYNNLLVLGSGFSFHNMQAFFAPETQQSKAQNQAFEDWLKQACCDPSLDESERHFLLANWQQAPYARYCHPREEHLLPLHICYGMAGRACSEHQSIKILGKNSGMFHWINN